jgi:hypothetical protein
MGAGVKEEVVMVMVDGRKRMNWRVFEDEERRRSKGPSDWGADQSPETVAVTVTARRAHT